MCCSLCLHFSYSPCPDILPLHPLSLAHTLCLSYTHSSHTYPLSLTHTHTLSLSHTHTGQGAPDQGRQLHCQEQRDHHRRRVLRPDHARPPLVRWAAPGVREGGQRRARQRKKTQGKGKEKALLLHLERPRNGRVSMSPMCPWHAVQRLGGRCATAYVQPEPSAYICHSSLAQGTSE
jgi:hypothetical protein